MTMIMIANIPVSVLGSQGSLNDSHVSSHKGAQKWSLAIFLQENN